MVSPVDEPPESSERQLRSMSNFGTLSVAAHDWVVPARKLRSNGKAKQAFDMVTSIAAIKHSCDGRRLIKVKERQYPQCAQASFQGLQESNEVADLVGIESKLGHGRMPGNDSLSQRLLQHPDRITFMQGPERRGDL